MMVEISQRIVRLRNAIRDNETIQWEREMSLWTLRIIAARRRNVGISRVRWHYDFTILRFYDITTSRFCGGQSFDRSFVRSFHCLSIHPRPFVCLSIVLLTFHSFICSAVCSFIRSLFRSIVSFFIGWFLHLFIPSSVCSLVDLLVDFWPMFGRIFYNYDTISNHSNNHSSNQPIN